MVPLFLLLLTLILLNIINGFFNTLPIGRNKINNPRMSIGRIFDDNNMGNLPPPIPPINSYNNRWYDDDDDDDNNNDGDRNEGNKVGALIYSSGIIIPNGSSLKRVCQQVNLNVGRKARAK